MIKKQEASPIQEKNIPASNIKRKHRKMSLDQGEQLNQPLPNKKIKQEEAQENDSANLTERLPETPPEANEVQAQPLEQIYWKRSIFYDRIGNTFTKIDKDNIRFVRSQQPLPTQGIFIYQLKVISQGSVGFGIMTNTWINRMDQLIYHKDSQAIFFASFTNGNGIFNINGLQDYKKHLSSNIHLEEGQYVNMIINMTQKYVIFVKDKVFAMIPFGENFNNMEVYPFFQVKNIGASIEVKKL